MIKITVLLENNAIEDHYKKSHGLSVLIEHENKKILLDVGPKNEFLLNAAKKNINLADVKYLFLSHNHKDHTGGINSFIEINKNANIYLMDNIDNKYYAKKYFFYFPIGLKIKKKNRSRIVQVQNDLIIDKNIYFLKNTVSEYRKPVFNKKLYKKVNGKIINDTFDHEAILVLEDNNELLIFNSCSHNGILNIIDTVRKKFPGKKIRCYVGGLHLINPSTKESDSDDYLNYLVNELKSMNITVYTGHCTGKYPFDFIKEKLGEKIQVINTGMEMFI